MKATNLILILLVVVSRAAVVFGQDSSGAEPPARKFYLAINLATPFGVYNTSDYLWPLSYISSNLNGSVYAEYRFKNFGVKIPVRFPILRTSSDDILQAISGVNSSYIDLALETNTLFEIGIKPVAYFKTNTAWAQLYSGIGIYGGSRNSFITNETRHYGFDPVSQAYDQYLYEEFSFTEEDPESYYRVAAVSGIEAQFKNGFGLAADVEAFIGSRVEFTRSYTTNGYENNGIYESDVYTYSLGGSGVQFNFYLSYRIK